MRFGIRDLVWLTLVAGVGLSLGIGWWNCHLSAKATQEELRAALDAKAMFESDAKDLGNMLDTFGRSMPQSRMDELRKKYVEKKLPFFSK